MIGGLDYPGLDSRKLRRSRPGQSKERATKVRIIEVAQYSDYARTSERDKCFECLHQIWQKRFLSCFQLMQLQELKPAIHLDNRYRLMRKEPMLDASGRETDTIGEDETAAPDLQEAFEKKLGCGRPRHSTK